jgi:hypothetical protein
MLMSRIYTEPVTFTFAWRQPFGLYEVRRYTAPRSLDFVELVHRGATDHWILKARAIMDEVAVLPNGQALISDVLDYLKQQKPDLYVDMTCPLSEFDDEADEPKQAPRTVGHLSLVGGTDVEG